MYSIELAGIAAAGNYRTGIGCLMCHRTFKTCSLVERCGGSFRRAGWKPACAERSTMLLSCAKHKKGGRGNPSRRAAIRGQAVRPRRAHDTCALDNILVPAVHTLRTARHRRDTSTVVIRRGYEDDANQMPHSRQSARGKSAGNCLDSRDHNLCMA
jgi:hypothetical protein